MRGRQGTGGGEWWRIEGVGCGPVGETGETGGAGAGREAVGIWMGGSALRETLHLTLSGIAWSCSAGAGGAGGAGEMLISHSVSDVEVEDESEKDEEDEDGKVSIDGQPGVSLEAIARRLSRWSSW